MWVVVIVDGYWFIDVFFDMIGSFFGRFCEVDFGISFFWVDGRSFKFWGDWGN